MQRSRGRSTLWLLLAAIATVPSPHSWAMSVVELRAEERTRGTLNSAAPQQFFYVNVSSTVGRDLSQKGSVAEKHLSIKLRRPGGEGVADVPMVLSACLDALPTGTSDESCPAKFVDSGIAGGRGDSTRSVEVLHLLVVLPT